MVIVVNGRVLARRETHGHKQAITAVCTSAWERKERGKREGGREGEREKVVGGERNKWKGQ